MEKTGSYDGITFTRKNSLPHLPYLPYLPHLTSLPQKGGKGGKCGKGGKGERDILHVHADTQTGRYGFRGGGPAGFVRFQPPTFSFHIKAGRRVRMMIVIDGLLEAFGIMLLALGWFFGGIAGIIILEWLRSPGTNRKRRAA